MVHFVCSLYYINLCERRTEYLRHIQPSKFTSVLIVNCNVKVFPQQHREIVKRIGLTADELFRFHGNNV